jgi:hypothetical protein
MTEIDHRASNGPEKSFDLNSNRLINVQLCLTAALRIPRSAALSQVRSNYSEISYDVSRTIMNYFEPFRRKQSSQRGVVESKEFQANDWANLPI